MHSVKRIEIIAPSFEIDKILGGLDKVGVAGYTVIRNVTGKGLFGPMSEDMDLGSKKLGNVYVLCCCPQDQVKPILEIIRPLLNKFGGVCYLSDAIEIRSLKCVASL
jgi:nitrogen regulatory protein PII